MTRTRSNKNVVFVDDEARFLKAWRESFESSADQAGFSIDESPLATIKDGIRALIDARNEARKKRPSNARAPGGNSLFDNADLVFVDYDLVALSENTAITGEDIAYLLRCFSSCGLIILLNPPELGEDYFDLRLRGTMESWADLSLGAKQLSNPWLIGLDLPDEFAPWGWQNLVDAIARRKKQITGVARALRSKRTVLDVVGFDSEAVVAMDEAMAEVVIRQRKPRGEDPETPEDESYAVAQWLEKSGFGLHRKDWRSLQGNEDQIARICASRISAWLEKLVLPVQSVLVDAPHLVSRLPGLVAGKQPSVKRWNDTASRDATKVSKAILESELKPYRFATEYWLSRPAWYWPSIRADENFAKWASGAAGMDLVFCEDTSRFLEREKATEFVADVAVPHARRYVQVVRPARYRPAARLGF